MIDDLMNEYVAMAEVTTQVDYADKKSIRRNNKASDRMRAIVDEVVALGPDAVRQFTSLLDRAPAANWLAHHLVEKADLDRETLAKCFAHVEREMNEAEANGQSATAMGQRLWLKEWRAKKG